MNEYIAYCGLDCEACEALQAIIIAIIIWRNVGHEALRDADD